METLHYHSTESPMPPRTGKEIGSTSFTGIPADVLDAVRDLASRQGILLRDVLTEAIHDLIGRLDDGATPDWPTTRPGTGGTPYNARLEVSVLEEMRAACEKHQVRKVVFFLAALRDHLRRNGYEIEV